MTNILSLVSGSDFSPRLSGGATQSSIGDGAFAGLLGESHVRAPIQGGNVATISLPTTASMTALVSRDIASPISNIEGGTADLPTTASVTALVADDVASPISNFEGETAAPPTGIVTSVPGSRAPQMPDELFALEPIAGDGELITAHDPASTNTHASADSSALSSSGTEQGDLPTKMAKKAVLIGSTVQNAAKDPLVDTSSSLDVAATVEEGKPEQAKAGAESISETEKTGRSLKSGRTKSDPSADGLLASAFPTAAPIEAAKQNQPRHEDGESFEAGEDASQKSKLSSDRAAPRTGNAQANPRAMAVSAQLATDGVPSEFARHLASDGGNGASSIVATSGAATVHGSTTSAEAIRLPSHTSPADTVIAARAGQIGKDLAVEIAKHSKDGRDSLTIRLDPAELGRIHVRMHFDDQGSLRAHVTAESHAALDMLRRDSQDLARALGDAGVRTDAQSFRFDGRGQDGSQQGQRHAQAWQQHDAHGHTGEHLPEEPIYRRLRTNGAVDLFA